MNMIDRYIREVLDQTPVTPVEIARIEADLRAHLADIMATGVSEVEAIVRMGSPTEVAAGFVENFPLQPAPRWWRVVAFFVDSIVCLPFVASLGLLMRVGHHAPLLSSQFALAIGCLFSGLLLVLFYAPILEARYGQTFGKRLFGLMVVQESGRRVTFGRACLRIAPLWVGGPPLLFIDRAFAIFTPLGRGAADLLAQTIVVRRGDPQPSWMRWGAVGLVVGLYAVFVALAVSFAMLFCPLRAM
jgi:uncharacterized RDD family membrane protein YckC